VRTIPFTVSVGWIPQILKLNLGVYSDDLEISYNFRPGVFREPPIFVCPIVARPKWTLAIVALLVGLFWVVVQKLLVDFLYPEHRAETMRLFLESLVRWDSWLWLFGVAVPVWLVVTLVNSLTLYRRSRELESAFQEQFPSV
jgi:hypothetical protein